MSRELVDRILSQLEGRGPVKVLEVGGRRSWLERRFKTISVYNCFDENPAEPGVTKHDPANPLPLPDASFDLALALGLFERVRMDQLYMVASETRRLVAPGGLWVLAGLAPGTDPLRWIVGGILGKLTGRRRLELMHYISPEDWKTVLDSKWNEGLLTRQLVVLERLE